MNDQTPPEQPPSGDAGADAPSFAPGEATQPKASRGSIGTVLLVIFIDLLGFGMVLPMLPYLAKVCPAPDWAVSAFQALGMPGAADADMSTYAVLVALLSFCFSFAQFVVAPFWGRLSDYIGRKPVLSMSLGGYLASWVLFYLAFAEFESITLLLISRLLAGTFAANISTAQAYIADVYPPEKRSKGMGLVGAAFGMGFTLGPAIGAGLIALERLILSDAALEHDAAGLRAPIVGAAGLTLIALLLALFRLPESLPKNLRGKAAAKTPRGKRLARLIAALRKPVTGGLLVGFFTATFGFAVLETLFSPFNDYVLGMSAHTNALVFSIIGVVIVVVQGGLIGRLTTRFGHWHVLFAGLVIEGGALVAFGFCTNLTEVIVVSILLALGSSLTNPSILALISRNADASEQGGTMGLTQSSSALGRLLGPILGGLVWGYMGPAWAFACGGAMVLLAVPVALRAKMVSVREADAA